MVEREDSVEPRDVPVDLRDVQVDVGSARLLSDIDLRISAGETVALLGANGSGKSTLVRAMLRIMPASRGSVRLFGASSARATDWDRIGYVPQRVNTGSPVPATAAEVVMTGLLGRRRWWGRPGDRARALDALEILGVADQANRPFSVLSGGQAQRVVIARALVREPELIVLDEPLAGVDVLTQMALARTLAQMHERGRTIVMVLHELGPFADLLDRTVVLSAGRIAHDGTPAQTAPHHPPHEHLHLDHGDREIDHVTALPRGLP